MKDDKNVNALFTAESVRGSYLWEAVVTCFLIETICLGFLFPVFGILKVNVARVLSLKLNFLFERMSFLWHMIWQFLGGYRSILVRWQVGCLGSEDQVVGLTRISFHRSISIFGIHIFTTCMQANSLGFLVGWVFVG